MTSRLNGFIFIAMIRGIARGCVLLMGWLMLLSSDTRALSNQDKTVLLTATVQESPAKIRLEWTAPTSGSYTLTHQKLYRRVAGQAWGEEYASIQTSDLSFEDQQVLAGVRYEYRLVRLFSNGPLSATGYIHAGIRLPLEDRRGALLLLVKDTAAAAMPTELARLQRDLAGDGWRVLRQDIAASDTVGDVKALIRTHWQNPANADLRTVFLFGRIPVPYSGLINPDGHTDHLGAWPADVYYGEMDGVWTDSEVDDTAAAGTRNDNVPGDGKFDPSVLPSEVELEVGRVDLANMTVFPDAATSENDLLLRYLHRNHAYRHRAGAYAAIPRRALIDDHWGYRGADTFASNAWWNFTPMLGASAITSADWFTTLASQSYLWAFGGGPGRYTSMSGIGNSNRFGSTDSKVVFSMMLGSYLGDWDTSNNFLRAPLAGTSGGLGLANVWAGRPHWHVHAMAMGETLGYGTRLTQNNVGDYPSGAAAASVHIALMGDPSLRMFPVLPVSGLSALAAPGRVQLSWTASTDTGIQGYAIYRGVSGAQLTGDFERIDGGLVSGTTFVDRSGVPGQSYTYMVRAVKLETTASGTYLNASQGVFVEAGPGSVTGPEISLFVDGNVLPDDGSDLEGTPYTSFGEAEMNLQSVTRQFTIRNDGAAALSLSGPSPVALSGGSGFVLLEQPVDLVLSPGEETTFRIRFSPTGAGGQQTELSLASDDLDEADYRVRLRATGLANSPRIDVPVMDFDASLAAGATGAETLQIGNTGLGDLDYHLGSEYGFRRSSDPGGPTYQWLEIAGVGERVTNWSGTSYATDNGGSPALPIGFAFPFYGQSFTHLVISTEGFVTFDSWVDAPSNTAVLPSLGAPSNLVALYWDDLDLRGEQGAVYTLQLDPDTFVIQYEGVYRYSSDPQNDDERLTCQLILKSSGEILLQYKEAPTTQTFAAGIQNDGLNRGLTCSVNGEAMPALSAIRILPPMLGSWLAVAPTQGQVAAMDTEAVNMSIDPAGMPYGSYYGNLQIRSNDDENPMVRVDLSLQGGEYRNEIALSGNGHPIPYAGAVPSVSNGTDFGLLAAGFVSQQRTITISNQGSADLHLGNVQITGDDFTLLPPEQGTLEPGQSTSFQIGFDAGKSVGVYQATVTVPSDDANEASFHFAIKARVLSGIEQWRLQHFNDVDGLADGADDGDPDLDGMVNLLEYALLGDPKSDDAAGLWPVIGLHADGMAELLFRRDPSRSDIRYTVEVSENLHPESWQAVAESLNGAETTGTFTIEESGSFPVEVRVRAGEADPPRRFYRLSIERQ